MSGAGSWASGLRGTVEKFTELMCKALGEPRPCRYGLLSSVAWIAGDNDCESGLRVFKEGGQVTTKEGERRFT